MKSIVEKKYEDLIWSFEGHPQVRLFGWNQEKIDPTPAYSHDMDVVKAEVDKLENIFDQIDATFFVSHFEGLSRTNGWANTTVNYDGGYDKEKRTYTDNHYYVFIQGKRTPIHPAMTRYLIPHEYGHCVQYWLEHQWDLQQAELITAYNKAFRKVEKPAYYGPGTWHLTPGEHFANDFRILLANAEVEYWPHPQVDRPEKVKGLKSWWQETLQDPSKDRYKELLAWA